MSRWVDEKFINLVSPQLDHFHREGQGTYAFRCPFCGDSQKHSNKTRGYFFFYDQKYLYKCHNCNVSMSLLSFLRAKAPELGREYLLERFRNERPLPPRAPETPMFGFTTPKPTPVGLPTIASLPSDHLAAQYCANRQLPPAALQSLHYTNEWTAWIRELGWEYSFEEDHAPRLVLPWYGRDGQLLGAQTRRIDPDAPSRYVTLKRDPDVAKIYGLDRLSYHKPIFVVEGPLDSWFLPNAVASMDSDLLRLLREFLSGYTAVYVWDNEPRNRAVTVNIQRAIRLGVPVVIWPSHIQEKDLNDMAMAGLDVQAIVRANTYQGLRAELEFLRWKKL